MKVSENFIMQEFLTPNKFDKIIETKDPLSEFYKVIDKRIVDIAQFIRLKFGHPIIINNWHSGGTYTLRGLRPKNCSIGAKNSQHKLGKAFDFNVVGISNEDVHKFIIDNQIELYKLGVRRMENIIAAPTWCHLDLKDHEIENKIIVFLP